MENSHTYRVVFSGRLLDGFDPAEVKRGLASQLGLSPEKIEAFFSGEKQVLKRADSLAHATRYVQMFARAGLVTFVERPEDKARRKAAPKTAKETKPRTAAPSLPPLKPWKVAWLYQPALWFVAAFELGMVLTWLALTTTLLVVLFHPGLLAGWMFALIPYAPVAAAAYAFLLCFGLLLAALLLKPLLVLPVRRHSRVTLTTEQEPDLYAFVEDICDQIQVPPPVEIRLSHDAALEAHFREAPRDGLIKGQTVLVLGMPLLVSLNVRQLAAAIAQTMHGWAPREAPRTVRFIERLTDWMHRALHQPDLVDRRLERLRAKAKHAAPLYDSLQRLITWSRLPLRLDLWFAHLLAHRLFQRRITRADAAARQLAGNADFRYMLEQSRVLAYAAQKTIPTLTRLWHDRGELPDNIAMAVVAQASYLPADVHQQLRQRQDRHIAQTRALQASDSQRLAWLDIQQEEGRYRCASDSTLLFRRFGKLMHSITMRYYHQHLRLPVTSKDLIRTPPKGSQEYEANHVIDCYFGTLYADFTPLGFETRFSQMPADTDTAIQHWTLSMALMEKERSKARAAMTALHQCDDDLVTVSNREVMHRAGYGSYLGELPLLKKQQEEIFETCREYEAKYEAALEDASKAVTPYTGRLAATLALLTLPEGQAHIDNGAQLHAEAEALVVKAGARIEHVYPHLRELRLHTLLLESLLSHDSPRAKRKLRDLIVEKTDDVNRTLQNIEVMLRSVPFPFPTPHKYRNVMHWVLRNALPEGGASAALDRGIDTFQNLALLQRLVVGRLCAIALQVEKAFDLKAPMA
ncbi:MAG: hypothetical protein Kow0096_12470 [Thiohalomonadaceae bacterium]